MEDEIIIKSLELRQSLNWSYFDLAQSFSNIKLQLQQEQYLNLS